MSPLGVTTSTESPTLLPIRARARGELMAKTAGLDVGLGLADQLIGQLLVGVLVDDGHGRTELHRLAGQVGDVDHLRAGDLVLELGQPALDEALALARGVVLGVFGEIAMLARLGDGADHLGAGHGLEMPQFLFHLGEALFGNGKSLSHATHPRFRTTQTTPRRRNDPDARDVTAAARTSP